MAERQVPSLLWWEFAVVVAIFAVQPTQILAPILWGWIGEWKPAQGAALGWFVGIATLVIGVLFNARQNRLRDDRLRELEKRSLADALAAEHYGFAIECKRRADALRRTPESYRSLMKPLPKFIIYEANAHRLGLLGTGWASSVVHTFVQYENMGVSTNCETPDDIEELADYYLSVALRSQAIHLALEKIAGGMDTEEAAESLDKLLRVLKDYLPEPVTEGEDNSDSLANNELTVGDT